MEERVDKILFEAIKRDDLTAFTSLVKQDRSILSFCYGRFPLLSLCYLYKSKRIVFNYEKRLNEPIKYTQVSEPTEAYERFKNLAKRNLRLYVFSQENTVTPLEMLAITGDYYYLESSYNKLRKSERAKENIERIFKNNDVKAVIKEDAIRIAKPITKLKKTILPIIILVCLVMSILPLSLAYAIDTNYGLGTKENPIKISDIGTFTNSFGREGVYFRLSSDLTIPEDFEPMDYRANLDGNGHTIKTFTGYAFIKNLFGEIRNLNFEREREQSNIDKSGSMFIETNRGVILNTYTTITDDIEVTTEEEILFACLAYENLGLIEGSKVSAQISIKSTSSSANLLFAVFVASNEGSIIDCQLNDLSEISADTVDPAGILVENKSGGVVDGCKNYAKIYQHTTNDNWNPYSAGIALLNRGTITNCYNFGEITASSEIQNSALQVVIGGIVSINHSSVTKCKNAGDIIANSKNMSVFAGGIAGVNNNKIIASSSLGNLSISSEYVEPTALVIGGGIAGHSFGSITNSFSSMTFDTNADNTYFGGISGLSFYYLDTDGESLVSFNSNNAFIYRDNAEISTILFRVGNETSLFIGFNENAFIANDLQELSQLAIYWE